MALARRVGRGDSAEGEARGVEEAIEAVIEIEVAIEAEGAFNNCMRNVLHN